MFIVDKRGSLMVKIQSSVHDAETFAFNVFKNMDHSLCQQLIGAVKDGSSTLYLLTHMYVTYSVITNFDCLATDKHFREAYARTDPIEVVWRQIDDAVAYSKAGSTTYSSK